MFHYPVCNARAQGAEKTERRSVCTQESRSAAEISLFLSRLSSVPTTCHWAGRHRPWCNRAGRQARCTCPTLEPRVPRKWSFQVRLSKTLLTSLAWERKGRPIHVGGPSPADVVFSVAATGTSVLTTRRLKAPFVIRGHRCKVGQGGTASGDIYAQVRARTPQRKELRTGQSAHAEAFCRCTCIASTAKGPQSFGVVSEDLCHGTPHALLAIRLIEDWLEDNVPVYSSITYVSDGAASHFKNRYQLFEFAQGGSDKARWLFSASGHGKNSCDGVGGLLNHLAIVHNFRSQDGSLIRTSNDFVEKIKTMTRSVVLFDLPEKEIEAFRKHKMKNGPP